MKNRIIILIVIFLVSLGFVNGGNNVKDAEPSVSSFDVVKSNEQDLYTGDLNLNLPLLNVPGRSLDVPLSLTYSSGIRVDDEASWVGLGWNLGVGAITRAINNEADDGLYGMFNSLPSGATRNDEGAQDSFFVTFQGGGGKLVFDNDNNMNSPTYGKWIPHMQSWKPWKIEYYDKNNNLWSADGRTTNFPYDGGIKKWIITTEDGTKYIFDKVISAQSTNIHRYVYTKRDTTRTCSGGDTGSECVGEIKCYPGQNGCLSPTRCSGTGYECSLQQCGVIPKCDNGIDDDGDGCVDYPKDGGCTNYYDNDESQAGCVKPGPKIVQVKGLDDGLTEDVIESKINLYRGSLGPIGNINIPQLPATGDPWQVQPGCGDDQYGYPPKSKIYKNQIEAQTVYEAKDRYANAWYLTEILGSDYADDDGIAGLSSGDSGSWVKISYEDEKATNYLNQPNFPSETFESTERITGYNKEGQEGVELTPSCKQSLYDHPFNENDINNPNYQDHFFCIGNNAQNDKDCRKYLNDKATCGRGPPGDYLDCKMVWFWNDPQNYNFLDCEFYNSAPLTNNYNYVTYSKVRSQVNFTYLDKIETPTHYASFVKSSRYDLKKTEYQGDYSDSNLARKLDRIDVYKKNIPGTPDTFLRSVNFRYANRFSSEELVKYGDGKLTLLGVKKVGYDTTTELPETKFEYGFNPVLELYALDWWGFYNGETTNYNKRIWTGGGNYITDNNEANDNARAWSLTKIIYPMKGSVSYEYEVDKYNYLPKDIPGAPTYSVGTPGGGIRVKAIKENNGIDTEKITTFSYDEGVISAKPVRFKGVSGVFSRIGVNEKNYVAYGKVTKVLPVNSYGKIVTTFRTLKDIPNSDKYLDVYGNIHNVSDWKIGQKVKEEYISSTGNVVKLNEYGWRFNDVFNNGTYGDWEFTSPCQGKVSSCATRAFPVKNINNQCITPDPDDSSKCVDDYCYAGCFLDNFGCQYNPATPFDDIVEAAPIGCESIIDKATCDAPQYVPLTNIDACIWDTSNYNKCVGKALSCGNLDEQQCKPEIGCSWVGDKEMSYGWVTQDYLKTTLDGVQTETYFKDYNKLNGLPNLTYEKGNDNEGRFTQIKYAFEIYNSDPLNMKAKNMLSEVYSTAVYDDTDHNGNFNPGPSGDLLYSLTTTEYNNYNGKIYPSASVAWIDDGDHLFNLPPDKILRTTYNYDIYGNLIQVTEPDRELSNNGGTVPGAITKYYYGTNTNECDNSISNNGLLHSVLTCVENNIGQRTKSHYDDKGNLIENVGLNNEITSYRYDVLGRLTKVTNQYDAVNNDINPLGGNKDITYNYATTISPTNLNSIQVIEDLDGINTINSVSYFDGFGNSLKLESGNTNKLFSHLRYNDVGLQSEASITINGADDFPVNQQIPTNVPKSTTAYYDDPLLRVKDVQAVGTTLKTTNSYEDYNDEGQYFMTTTTNEGGGSLKAYTDKFGRLRLSENYDGTFNVNEYNIMGNVVKVINAKHQVTNNYYDSLGRLKRTENNDFGFIENVYDGKGNNIVAKIHNGQRIDYVYDSSDRITKIDYPNENEFISDVNYYYDNYNTAPIGCVSTIGSYFSQVNYPKGRLTVKEDNAGTSCYYYNKNGQLAFAVKSIKIDAVNTKYYGIKYEYNKKGLVSSITYPVPFNKVINYEYDEYGRLSKVKDGTDVIYSYNDDGTLNNIAYPNGVSNSYTYDNRLFLQTSKVSGKLNNIPKDLIKRFYEYDSVGNINKVYDGLDIANRVNLGNFNYDTNYRLDTVTTSQAKYYGDFNYDYDEVGNIIQATHDGNVRMFSYDPSGKNNKLTFSGKNSGEDTEYGDWFFSYDDNGNVVGKVKEDNSKIMNMYYDFNSNLIQVNYNDGKCSKYYYDGGGARYKKIEYDMTNNAYKATRYIYGTDGNLLQEEEDGAGTVDCTAPNILAPNKNGLDLALDNRFNTIGDVLGSGGASFGFGEILQGIGDFFTGNAVLDNYEFNIKDVTKDGNKLNILVESKTSNPVKLRFTIIGDNGNNQIYSENYINAFESKIMEINYSPDIGNLKTLKAIPYAFENNEFVYYSLNDVSYSLENVKEVSSGVVAPIETTETITTGTITPAKYIYINDGARI
ncbi:MAG TPA: hypothetical protein VJJ23_00430, partial [Candidatus Nanoarchaeia archaeon]|nr:hypothetical protein [Candidatus Nanoarchaeia archaeon]